MAIEITRVSKSSVWKSKEFACWKDSASIQREHFLVNSPWPLATGPGCRDTDNLPLNSDLPVTGMAHAPRMLWEKKKDSVVADSVG